MWASWRSNVRCSALLSGGALQKPRKRKPGEYRAAEERGWLVAGEIAQAAKDVFHAALPQRRSRALEPVRRIVDVGRSLGQLLFQLARGPMHRPGHAADLLGSRFFLFLRSRSSLLLQRVDHLGRLRPHLL